MCLLNFEYYVTTLHRGGYHDMHNNNVNKEVELIDKLVITKIFTTIGTKCAF